MSQIAYGSHPWHSAASAGMSSGGTTRFVENKGKANDQRQDYDDRHVQPAIMLSTSAGRNNGTGNRAYKLRKQDDRSAEAKGIVGTQCGKRRWNTEVSCSKSPTSRLIGTRLLLYCLPVWHKNYLILPVQVFRTR
jgi:hypothetical protein